MTKKNYFIYGLLVVIFILTYMVFLGSYNLLEPDECRYVDMARHMLKTHDYMTLYLNGDFFFEKPPLYFWIECISFKIFNCVNELTARLPVVILSLLPVGILFSLCKKIKDTNFAMLASIVLFTSLEYIIITKLAILDSILTTFAVSSVLCYFYTFFVENKNKKYFWILSYIFCALAVLAKGIPGFVIPVFVIFISSIIFKKFKESVKYFILGLLIIFLVAAPWHILMLKIHNPLFFEEYIVKHHILRFLGSEVINRKQPFYFYFVTILWGAAPWIFSFLFNIFAKIKNCTKIKNFNIQNLSNLDKFYILNVIAVLAILLFFSSSGTKLITYILPIYPFLAVIIAKTWYDYIFNNSNQKIIIGSIYTINIIFAIALIVSTFIHNFLPENLISYIIPMKKVVYILFPIYLIMSFTALKLGKKLAQFILLALFMSVFSAFFTPLIYNLDYFLGQDDLVKYAILAKENNYSISTYKTGKKYCLLYYSNLQKIDFHFEDEAWLKNEIAKTNNYLIIRNKDLDKLNIEYKIIQKGVKYSIIGK